MAIDTSDTEFQQLKKLYFFFALSMGCMWVPHMLPVFAGSVLLLVGAVKCYKRRKLVPDTVYENHYQWLIRTFWIGTAVVMPLATIAATIYIFKNSDLAYLQRLFYMGGAANFDASWYREALRTYYADHTKMILTAVIPAGGFVLFWWFGRLIKGYKRLKMNMHLPFVTSWLF